MKQIFIIFQDGAVSINEILFSLKIADMNSFLTILYDANG